MYITALNSVFVWIVLPCQSILLLADSNEDNKKPKFTLVPKDGFPREGYDHTLNCFAVGDPKPSIEWYKDGVIVQTHRDRPGTSNRITNNGELVFLRFGKLDEGTYSCNASNIYGWTISSSAEVRMAFFNTAAVFGPTDVVTNVGESVTLDCKPPDGLPKPTITWMFGNSSVVSNDRLRLLPNGTLKIDSIEFSDHGSYYCSANNIIGVWRSPSAMLTVTRQPQINKQAMIGTSIEFPCKIADNTNSTAVWTRSGKEIPRALLRGKSLYLVNVQLSDSGTYICKTESSMGYVQALVHLSVLSPPTLSVTPDDTVAAINSLVMLNCLTTGSPPPTVRWIHNDKTYWVPFVSESLESNDRIHVLSNGSLVINPVLPVDGGYYECRASQIVGIVRSFAKLIIQTPSIPLIEVGPQNQTIVLDTTATLRCDASVFHYPDLFDINSSSSVQVHWFVNGITVELLNDPRIVVLRSGYLQIHSVRISDHGNYTCQAVLNGFTGGRYLATTWSAIINVSRQFTDEKFANVVEDINIPRPPTNISILDVGDSWITIEVIMDSELLNTDSPYSDKNADPSPGFRVEVATYNSKNAWRVIIPFSPQRILRLFNLDPLTAYHVLVRSVMHGVVGRPYILKSLVFTTGTLPINSYPSAEFLSQLNQLTFSQSLLRPISYSEVLVHTKICGTKDFLTFITGIRANVHEVPIMDCMSFNSNSNTFSIPNGRRLMKSSSECLSPRFAFTNTITETDFCSLSQFSQLVTWNRRVASVLDYKRLDFTVHSGFKPPLLTFVLSNLKPFTCYSVELLAFAMHNQLNRSFSHPTSGHLVLTYESVPLEAPRLYRAHWLDNGNTLGINWSQPPNAELGGILTGYSIWILSSINPNESIRVEPERTFFKFKHLSPWLNYTIYLAALNCRGVGVRSLPLHVLSYPLSDKERPQILELGDNEVVVDVEYARNALVADESAPHVQSSVIRWFTYGDRQSPVEKSNHPEQLQDSGYIVGNNPLLDHPWFIPGLIGGIILVIMIIILMAVVGLYRNKRSKFHHISPNDEGLMSKNGRLMPPPDSYPSSGLSSNNPLLFKHNSANGFAFCSSSPSSLPHQYTSLNSTIGGSPLPGIGSYDPSHNLIGGSFASTSESTINSAPLRQLPPVAENNDYFGPPATGLSPRINVPNPCDGILVPGGYQPAPTISANGALPTSSVAYAIHPHQYPFKPQTSLSLQGVVSGAVINQSVPPYLRGPPEGTDSYPLRADPRSFNHSSASSSASPPSVGYPPVPMTTSEQSLPSLGNAAHIATSGQAQLMTEDDRLVNPYASVPVVRNQQSFPNQLVQLSLAEIIPPPPDYPPPSVPPSESSPLLTRGGQWDRQLTPPQWHPPIGNTDVCPTPPNSSTVFYAQSDLPLQERQKVSMPGHNHSVWLSSHDSNNAMMSAASTGKPSAADGPGAVG